MMVRPQRRPWEGLYAVVEVYYTVWYLQEPALAGVHFGLHKDSRIIGQHSISASQLAAPVVDIGLLLCVM